MTERGPTTLPAEATASATTAAPFSYRLSHRIAAFLIDCLVCYPGWQMANLAAALYPGGTQPGHPIQYLKDLCFHLMFFGYFAVSEGIWQASVGKRLLRLQVADSSTVGRPALGQVLIRAVLLTALLFFLPNTIEFLTASDGIWIAASLVGMAVIAAPMRPVNGYRGLHELLSRTRVTRRPPQTEPLN